tara:strand:+ start:384 stop:734 length:351 start_codon:yes stop_codon:yes gene_type:complete
VDELIDFGEFPLRAGKDPIEWIMGAAIKGTTLSDRTGCGTAIGGKTDDRLRDAPDVLAADKVRHRPIPTQQMPALRFRPPEPIAFTQDILHLGKEDLNTIASIIDPCRRVPTLILS